MVAGSDCTGPQAAVLVATWVRIGITTQKRPSGVRIMPGFISSESPRVPPIPRASARYFGLNEMTGGTGVCSQRGRWMMVEDVDGLLRGPGCDLGRGFHLVPRLLDPVADGLQDWVTDGVTLSDLAPDSTRTATVDRISPRRFLKLVVAQTP